jgi:hypothetical protein
LYSEDRNNKLIDALREHYEIPERKKSANPWMDYGVAQLLCDFVLNPDTELIVNRYYIRQGKEEFDSVTFYVTTTVHGKKVKGRFWAKLDDVNNIEAKVI